MRKKIWLSPCPLVAFKGVVLGTRLRFWYKVLYRNLWSRKCHITYIPTWSQELIPRTEDD